MLARAAADRALVATLRANGRTRWHIEYGAFGLSNHLAHGVIALRHLGATDTMVAAWIKTYEVHQTAGNTLEKARVEMEALEEKERKGAGGRGQELGS